MSYFTGPNAALLGFLKIAESNHSVSFDDNNLGMFVSSQGWLLKEGHNVVKDWRDRYDVLHD